MAYLSAKHIAIKKNQDRTYCEANKIILCDGIGEFPQSDLAAEMLIENIANVQNRNEITPFIERTVVEIKNDKIIGGTTLITAIIDNSVGEERVEITYIGNGSIYHLPGDYNDLPLSYSASNKASRFSNILIPHVDKEGTLLRHISHHSTLNEIVPSSITMSLSGIHGDIILIFSDGISSLENEIIVMDDQKRIWRNQSESVSFILDELHTWLIQNSDSIDQLKMDQFLETTLSKLKEAKKLEDDASIGLIITETVLKYYKELYNAS